MKIALSDLQRHDHACMSFNLDSEFVDYAARIVQTGVRGRESCLVIAQPNLQDRISERLALVGLDPERMVMRSELNFVTPDSFYLTGGNFEIERLIERIERMLQDLLRKGFAGVRGIGGVDDGIARKKMEPDKMIDYEMQVQSVFHKYPLCCVCAYRRSVVPDGFYEQIVQLHPFQVLHTLSLS